MSRAEKQALGEAATLGAAGSYFGPGGVALGVGAGLVHGYTSGQQADEDNQAAIKRSDALKAQWDREFKLPDYDKTPFSPQDYKLLSTYNPEFARFIQEKHPQLVTEAASAGAKAAQNRALDQYGQMAQSGNDAQSIADTEKARFTADSDAGARRNRVLQEYGQQATGGQALLSNIAGSQQDDQGERMAALNAAAGASQRRMSALSQYAGLAGNIRSENNAVEQGNNSVINAFNTRNSQNLQSYENSRAQLANQAQLHNEQQGQAISNLNTGLSNQAQQFNIQRGDTHDTNMATFSNNRLTGSTGLGQATNALQTEAAASNNAANNGMFQAGLGAVATGAQLNSADRTQALNEAKAGMTYDKSSGTYSKTPGSQVVGMSDEKDPNNAMTRTG